jgi:hypothetical protein
MILEPKLSKTLLKLLLKPVVGFCLRHSLKIQDLTEVGKALFVELAKEQLLKSQRKAGDAAISVMTGMHRRDITRFKLGELSENISQSVVFKMIGHWQTDKRFVDVKGKSRILSYGFEDSEFSSLVYSVSSDITASAVLGEMERIGAIARTDGGLKLVIDTFVPKGNPEKGFSMLSNDCNNLIGAVEQNVLHNLDVPNMHYSTVYDRVDPDAIPEIRKWLLEQGRELHLKARQHLSQYDLDINPKRSQQENSNRVVITTFSLIDNN